MYIAPMLLHKQAIPKDDSNYLSEPKWDGHRVILSKINGVINLYTRHGNNVTYKYPELTKIELSDDIVLDGEIIYYDPIDNRDDFETLMSQRFLLTNRLKIKQAATKFPVVMIAFDILRLHGQNLCYKPLIERKRILQECVPNSTYLQKNTYIEGNGSKLFKTIKERKLEGIVQKDKNSLYIPAKRSKDWNKVIAYNEAIGSILGYRKKDFGWLIGIKTHSGFNSTGIIEFGPSNEERKVFYQLSKTLITKETKEFVYIDPVINCKVKFRNLTKNNKLRIPIFEEFVY